MSDDTGDEKNDAGCGCLVLLVIAFVCVLVGQYWVYFNTDRNTYPKQGVVTELARQFVTNQTVNEITNTLNVGVVMEMQNWISNTVGRGPILVEAGRETVRVPQKQSDDVAMRIYAAKPDKFVERVIWEMPASTLDDVLFMWNLLVGVPLFLVLMFFAFVGMKSQSDTGDSG